MVADFISADYRFLHSKDGSESTQVLFRAGKARDSYLTNQNITAHAAKAMNILEKDYPNEDHVLIFDNVSTHLKRADNAQRAITYMGGQLPNRNLQSLYFPKGPNNKAGWFKGMSQILVEWGFKCPVGRKNDCCCCRLMYSHPDFANVESVLEALCTARGFNVIFLPKFHWFAKWIYCMKDSSSSAAALEKNIVDSLDAVPMLTIQQFSIRSARFIDTYHKGLDGTQAAWVVKKYHGHRILPTSNMKEFDEC
ncbi:hypothetical protein BDR03DRAFT_936585 [Suillus americanus]|nr:hypothetical protein BDR03DRAFT_936585 [Suillus americanus]